MPEEAAPFAFVGGPFFATFEPVGLVFRPLYQGNGIVQPARIYEDATFPHPSIGRQWIGGPMGAARQRRYSAARGLYRVYNDAEYRFYRSNSGPPLTTDTPYATHATLPYQPSSTFADGTWRISVSYFNGVFDSGFYPIGPRGETYLTLNISGGADTGSVPAAPTGAHLEVRAGGVIRVVAFYVGTAPVADHWAIAYTTDGTTPPNGSPSITPAMRTGLVQALAYDLPAQSNGTTVKVQLQTKKGSAYSVPGAVLSAVADASGPSAPAGAVSWVGQTPEDA